MRAALIVVVALIAFSQAEITTVRSPLSDEAGCWLCQTITSAIVDLFRNKPEIDKVKFTFDEICVEIYHDDPNKILECQKAFNYTIDVLEVIIDGASDVFNVTEMVCNNWTKICPGNKTGWHLAMPKLKLADDRSCWICTTAMNALIDILHNAKYATEMMNMFDTICAVVFHNNTEKMINCQKTVNFTITTLEVIVDLEYNHNLTQYTCTNLTKLCPTPTPAPEQFGHVDLFDGCWICDEFVQIVTDMLRNNTKTDKIKRLFGDFCEDIFHNETKASTCQKIVNITVDVLKVIVDGTSDNYNVTKLMCTDLLKLCPAAQYSFRQFEGLPKEFMVSLGVDGCWVCSELVDVAVHILGNHSIVERMQRFFGDICQDIFGAASQKAATCTTVIDDTLAALEVLVDGLTDNYNVTQLVCTDAFHLCQPQQMRKLQGKKIP